MLVVGSARAAPAPRVAVEIRSQAEPLVVELYPPRAKPLKDAPIERCTTPCSATLPAGRYRLYVHGGDGTVSGSRIVDVSQPLILTARPKSSAQRVGGLALGLTGPAMILAGAFMRLSGLCAIGHGDTECGDTESKESLGTALMLGGALTTPIGWLLYSDTFKVGVKEAPLQYSLAPTLFPRASGAGDHVPGFVLTGTF